MHLIARVTAAMALATLTLPAFADVDPDTFPPELRAMEWREVGPYRGGRSAAVTGLPSDEQTYYMGATGGGVWKNAGRRAVLGKHFRRLLRWLDRCRRGVGMGHQRDLRRRWREDRTRQCFTRRRHVEIDRRR